MNINDEESTFLTLYGNLSKNNNKYKPIFKCPAGHDVSITSDIENRLQGIIKMDIKKHFIRQHYAVKDTVSVEVTSLT